MKIFLLTIHFLIGLTIAMAQSNNNLSQKANYEVSYFDLNQLTYLPDTYTEGHQFFNGYAQVKKDSLWGYINTKGKLVIGYKYAEAHSFFNGYAVVKTNSGKWQIIDELGNVTLQTTYNYLFPLVANDTAYFIAKNEDSLYGIINATGDVVIPFSYAYINPIYTSKFRFLQAYKPNKKLIEGLQNNKFDSWADFPDTEVDIFDQNFILQLSLNSKDSRYKQLPYKKEWSNEKGQLTKTFFANEKEKKKPSFSERFEPFFDQMVESVYTNEQEKMGVTNAKGKKILPTIFDNITPMMHYAEILDTKQLAFAKKRFNAQPIKDEPLSNSYIIYYYVVTNKGFEGIYDLLGNEIISPHYKSISVAENLGFLATELANHAILYNFKGDVLIPSISNISSVGRLINDRFTVTFSASIHNNNYFTYQALANSKGEFLTPKNKYFNIRNFYGEPKSITANFAEVLIPHQSTFLYGLIDRDGNEIIAPKYKYISFYDAEKIAVLQDFDNPQKLYFYDFEQQKIINELETKAYNQFLIGMAKNHILRIYTKKEE